MSARSSTPKGLIDHADLQRLLLAFPELKSLEGLVADSLKTASASEVAHQAWMDLVAREILPDDEDAGF
jgi:hypothetical protein